jgi:hypothetical protein
MSNDALDRNPQASKSKNELIIQELLKDPENAKCADCAGKGTLNTP